MGNDHSSNPCVNEVGNLLYRQHLDVTLPKKECLAAYSAVVLCLLHFNMPVFYI
jgi:hypothetical protein